MVRGMLGAIGGTGVAPSPAQVSTFTSFATLVLGYNGDVAGEAPLAPGDLAAALTDPGLRQFFVRVLVTIEFVAPALAGTMDERVVEYAAALEVDEPMVRAAHDLAEHRTVLMYADIQRHSWYNHETVRRALGGHVIELLRSKLAALGGPEDSKVAARWRALDDCAPESWGRAVYDFYQHNGFALPGERHSIREVGAEHDWVHVLADYDTSPEGELDVFSFIAGSMESEEGLAMLAATLGIYQNGTVHHVAGQDIPTATSGTLGDPDAMQRFIEAYVRGGNTSEDVLDLDHFAWKDVALGEARTRLNVAP